MLLLFFLATGGLSPNSFIWYSFKIPSIDRYSYIYQALEKIPNNVALSAQSPLVPHLANREKIYLFPEVLDAEYIILDTDLSAYPLKRKDLINKISQLKDLNWEIFHKEKTLIILKK